MCCGQKRAETRNNQAPRAARTTPKYASENSQVQAIRTQRFSPPTTRDVMPQQPATAHTRGVQSSVPPPIFIPNPSISVRYRENSPIRVRGKVSGRHYVFSNSRPIQLV